MDEENLSYLRKVLTEQKQSQIVISFGASLEICETAIQMKVKFFEMVKEIRPNDTLYQITTESMEPHETGAHVLHCGIKYGNEKFRLTIYIVPNRLTTEEYIKHNEDKEIRRQNFIKNVLGKRKKADGEESLENTTGETTKPSSVASGVAATEEDSSKTSPKIEALAGEKQAEKNERRKARWDTIE